MRDSFKIKDENGKEVYQVIGKVFAWGDQLSFQDMDGNQLYFIKQKPINLLKTYEVHKGPDDASELLLGVKKKFTLMTPKFSVEAEGGAKYELAGNFMQHSFKITKDGKVAATVDKKFFAMSDVYGVDVADGEDPGAMLSLCIVVDQALHDD